MVRCKLCRDCHDSAKRTIEVRGYSLEIGVDGWPVDPTTSCLRKALNWLVPDELYQRFCEQKACAKRRGIPWLLPYWQWLQIWQDSGHLDERGRFKDCWVMGRNGDAGPYAEGNVKIIRAETNNEQGIRRAAARGLLGRSRSKGRV